MLIVPRDYQVKAIDSIFSFFNTHKKGNPVVAAPCGVGKAVMIAGFLEIVFKNWPNQKIIVATHVKELVLQNHTKLINMWPSAPAGIYSAGLRKRDTHNNIIFAGIGSIAKRGSEFNHVNLLIVDECDLVSPSEATMYRRLIFDLMKVNPRLRVIGLTATPWRTKTGSIVDGESIFTHICFDATGVEAFNWFIDEGYLSPLIPRETEMQYDVSGVGTIAGEYNQRQLNACVDRYELTLAALTEAADLGVNRNCWLIFCAGVEHSIHAAEILNDMGIPTGCVHSGSKEFPMTDRQRDEEIRAFDNGQYRAITNNSVLSVGYDNHKIDMIVHLKPGKSSRKWVQELGRLTRPDYEPGYNLLSKQGRLDAIADGHKSDGLVLDFAGNTVNLGAINNPVIPGQKGKGNGGGGQAPVKTCPSCKTYIPASSRECWVCAYEFPEASFHIATVASTEELIVKEVEVPDIQVFTVDHVTYTKHVRTSKAKNKSDKGPTGIPSLLATYYCGLRSFKQFVHFEHNGMRASSHIWWSLRSDEPVPKTVDGALSARGTLKVPNTIHVWVNKKQFPEIVKVNFG